MKEGTNIKELNHLLEKISVLSQESPTYKKLAYFIEKNYKNVIFMTASEVAEKAGASQGSVSRFCIALGYKGYNDFLHNLQQFVRKEITAPQRLQYISNFRQNTSNIMDMEHQNIEELKKVISQPEYRKIVEKLASCGQLILISARMSATLLPYTYYVLNKMKDHVIQATPHEPLWETMEMLDPAHVQFLAIVFPRYPNILLNKLETLHKKGFRISAITDSITSPVVKIADEVVCIPITTSSIFDIYSTPVLFLNLLMRDVARLVEGVDKRISILEKLDQENQTYFKTAYLKEDPFFVNKDNKV
ncbi:SIS domain-containing protein [Bacillus coagulans]|uniref:MurR/RpiR family transcriptional regulator n=1 Tax=Heyndrickxia coagulans TaxID=1398 RepID=UPI001377ECDB|nr:MurR/RpiR family transcriptional regulator [Heyndrickxia coagulans]NCG68989.1 SIS domain-containing protein [Heyndrickxia coagulans]